ncbi:Na+/H+ antiporter subunit E [Azonexus sp.]|jgi:multicomponent K+:H+ antiporter subunit E|uniref:Na+/H+ antiporter subunit E n=1 Tax=Azonexus sp. TaxID=1872668 RepID=UPI002817F66A|nr:Na+/H+ antiporter subunit E [Azonexus sp.]MDR1996348.1 Na+/H+ antiporter subunit E [Azonexus sp.]
MMRTGKPPLLEILLLIMWLVVNQSLELHHWLLGLLFALPIGRLVRTLRPRTAHVRRLDLALILCWHVFCDVVRSNFAVGRIILGTVRQQPKVGFLDIPLEIRDPHGLAALSIIITATPGTVFADHDPDSNVLTLHVLDLQDEATWLHTIKHRYERPLMEIFE